MTREMLLKSMMGIINYREQITYSYDDLYRPTAINGSNGSPVSSYTYDINSNPLSCIYPNGVEASHSYDSLNRLTEVINKQAAKNNIISSYTYTYDNVGNKIEEVSHKGTNAYLYDRIYRLGSAEKLEKA